MPKALVALLGFAALFGCGGGGGGESPPPQTPAACQGWFAIDTPTYAGTWETDQPAIEVGGWAPTPGGPYSGNCPGDPGYTMTWRNEGNDATGPAYAWTSKYYGVFGPYCHTRWHTSEIPLVVGDNRIRVSGGSALGEACIVVRRLPDTAPPLVSSTSPADGAVNVPLTVSITVQFNEPMDRASITTATFVLRDPQGNAVSGSVTVDASGRTATFKPSAPLAYPRTYTATVTTGVRDAAGNALAADRSWNFSTGAVLDTAPPVVTATDPPAGSECMATLGTVSATFDEPIDPLTLPAATFVLRDAQGAAVPASVSYAQPTARLQPTVSLSGGAHYTATVTTGVKDLAGNALAADYAWTFRTGTELGSWQRTATASAPYPRSGHFAVWTGTELIVAGGFAYLPEWNRFEYTATGARYDPVADAWTPITVTDAPSARVGHTAVWTGAEMIVWGSRFGTTHSGGRYDPTTDTWRPTSTLCAPTGREGHVAVWTGSRMLVWGGYSGAYAQWYVQGAAYDPAADAWQAMSATDAPAARFDHSGVWTGSRFIVWGGRQSGTYDTGGRFTP